MVNSRFAVAVHILTLLALNREKPLSSRFIAGSVNTNPVVIRRILGVLGKAGLVITQLGVEGGASLACPPEQITLLEVYQLMERGDLFALHHQPPNSLCPCGRNIQPVLLNIYRQAEAAMATTLAKTTIAQVVQDIELSQSETDIE